MHILITMGERRYCQQELKHNHSSHLFAGDTVIGNTQKGYVNRDRERNIVKHYKKVYWVQGYNERPDMLIAHLSTLFEHETASTLIFHDSVPAKDVIAILKGLNESLPKNMPAHFDIDLSAYSETEVSEIGEGVFEHKLMVNNMGAVIVRGSCEDSCGDLLTAFVRYSS